MKENPKESIVDYLEKLKKIKLSNLNPPSLIEDTNLTSIFGMLDPSGKGFITFKQYFEGEYLDMSAVGFFLSSLIWFLKL